MELTGKAKEEFEKWYNNDIKKQTHKLIHLTDSKYFNLLTDSMQYGVYVDFFDSVGLKIFIEPDKIEMYYLFITPNDCVGTYCIGDNIFITRQEAREQAIKKANEIFNNRIE